MKKLKLLLLALAVVALCVCGVAVTASADNSLTEDTVFAHNITLESDFVLNVYVNKNATDVTLDGVAVEPVAYNGTHNVVEIPVPAKNAADAHVVACTFNGEPQSFTTSVIAYANAAIEAYSNNALLTALANAVKDYAKAASAYFEYNVDGFEDYTQSLTTAENSGVQMTAPGADFLAVITGAKLRLDESVAFVFGVAENATGNVTLTYNYGGVEKTETVSVDGKSEIAVYVKAIDLNSGVTVTVGNESVTYGLQNYIYSMSSHETYKADANLMALLAYMDNYSKASTAYLSLKDFIVVDNGDGTYKISGVANKDATELVVPNNVTQIYAGAFAGCNKLESLTIPFTGTNSGSGGSKYFLFGYIFGETEYEGSYAVAQYYTANQTLSTAITYYIPSTLTNVKLTGSNGDTVNICAFINCTSLKTVDLSESGAATIGANAFRGCTSLTTITLPETLTTVNAYAFYDCSSIASIVFPASVQTFNNRMLNNNAALKTIVILNTAPNFANSAWVWYGAQDKSLYVKADPATYNTTLEAFNNTSNRVTSVYYYSETQPTDTTYTYWHYDENGALAIWTPKIEKNPLDDFTYTDNGNGTYTITGLTEAGKAATELVVPNTVTKINAGALAGANKLESLTLPFTGANAACNAWSGGGAGLLGYIFGTTEYEGSYAAIQYMKNSTSTTNTANQVTFYIPSTLTTVKLTGKNTLNNNADVVHGAFSNCNTLTTVDLSESGATGIGVNTFRYCSSLTNIILPDTLTMIGQYAFDGSAISSIVLPESFKTFTANMFYGCGKLKTIVILNTAPTFSSTQWVWYGAQNKSLYVKADPATYNTTLTALATTNARVTSVYYYSETQPTDTTYTYWHYDANNNIVVWDVAAE